MASRGDELARYEATQVLMGMDFKLLVYAADEAAAKRATDAAFARIAELNGILSDYDPESELSRLSRSAGKDRWVELSPELAFVLGRSKQLTAQTDGAFDVTVGPFVQLWRRARRQRELPSAPRLAEARKLVGNRLWELDATGHKAKLTQPGMRLDLGGIGAGYAADEALRVLREHGISRGMIDASGDVVTGEPPPGQQAWRIGIAPATPGEEAVYLELAGQAVAHSGDTEQFVEVGGKRYSHIVDPATGLGLTTRIGVTVIAADGISADSLATAASVLGPARGLKLIEDTAGAECRIVAATDAGREEFRSPGFERFVVPEEKPATK